VRLPCHNEAEARDGASRWRDSKIASGAAALPIPARGRPAPRPPDSPKPRLFREFEALTPYPKPSPFTKSFDSFADYERWRRAQRNPWNR
jgi:hypothetical protein